MKNLFIFDCFGVIIKNDPSTVFMKNNLFESDILYLRKNVFPKADIGELDMQYIFNLLSQKTNKTVKDISEEYKKLCEVDNNVVDYIKKIKENNIVVLLSNCPSGFLPKILKENNIEKLFDDIIISCDVKMIKPNKDIFNLVTEKFKGKYNKSIFIDDNEKNVMGAKNANIDYLVHFIDFDSFKQKIAGLL